MLRGGNDVCYYCHMEHASTVCEPNAGIIVLKTIQPYVNNLVYFDDLNTKLTLSFMCYVQANFT
jgi:hypothetical protein